MNKTRKEDGKEGIKQERIEIRIEGSISNN